MLLWVGELGYYFDPETGLLSVRARIFSPAIGRWISIDPLELLVGLVSYIYVSNRPVAFIDPSGLALFRADMVAKSFINGANPIGAIVPDRPGGAFPALFASLLLQQLVSVGANLATTRLAALAKAVGILKAFNENPTSDAKDHVDYRLYTRVNVQFDCCENNISIKSLTEDMDGGDELTAAETGIPGFPTIAGTIALSPLQTINASADTTIIIWRGWGHPNDLVEPGMQFVATRTSVNIWHKPEVWLMCRNGVGKYSVKSFQGSKFPSRRLWINGDLKQSVAQGTFSDLWNADPSDPTFVSS